MNPDLLAQAVELLRGADSLLITAGAGMGVDSGLPGFRGNEGFWRAYPALAQAGLSFSAIASPDTFRKDPALAWGFYGHRLQLYRRTEPHAGFDILNQWATRFSRGAFVYTSNVDGQFQKAGFDPDRIVECHGIIHHLQCMDGCFGDTWLAPAVDNPVDMAACRMQGELPHCRHCEALARPNILMFGDSGWISARTAQQEHRFRRWCGQLQRPVVLELGAGTVIPSVRIAGESLDAPIIRINPHESAVRGRGVGLAVGALEALRELDRLWG